MSEALAAPAATTATAQFSMVMLLKPFTYHQDKMHNNFERFLYIGMKTYDTYMDRTAVRDFFVIVPKNDVDPVTKLLKEKYPLWPWKVISEETLLLPSIPAGWARQQLVKLAICMIVQTDHYLIVDDDTYLTRPFGYTNLFAHDTNRLLMNRMRYVDFPFFFLWSAQLLKCDYDKTVNHAPCHMAITPEIFITNEVKDLVKWLVEQYGIRKAWQLHLANHKFTEYAMYWLWLLQKGTAASLYATEGHEELYAYATTDPEATVVDMQENVRRSFEEGNHYFSFIQSSCSFSVPVIQSAVEEAMNKKWMKQQGATFV